MAWTPVLRGSTRYPELLLEWAPTSLPTDASQSWEDITDRLRDWSWGYGRNDELGRFEAGNGHVTLDNRDREMDPSFDAGAWFGLIKPRRMFRLRAKYAGVEYPVFVAYAQGFPQTYPADGADSVVTVELVDAYAILQAFDLVVGFTRDAELTGDRTMAVFDAVGIPAALHDCDDGTVTVAAIDVTAPGTSGLDHAKQVVAESEMGQLFAAKDGTVRMQDYNHRLNAVSAHTFSDSAGAALAYTTALEPDYDLTYTWNYVRVTGAAGDDTALVATDAASDDEFHTLTKTVATQLVNGSEIQQVADRYILRYAQPELRLPAMTVVGAGNPAARWPVLLALEISTRITVERFADTADPMELVQDVEGIRHTCGAEGPWTTTLTTSPADTRAYLELNDATLGELDDVNALA